MYNQHRKASFKRFQHRNHRKKPAGIDPSLFVKKADPTKIQPEETVSITFNDLNLLPDIKTALAKRKFDKPTPIQAKAIPHVLDGKDVIGLANTGTGKTGAFVLPLIQKIVHNPQERVLIMVPTRELGQQIKEELFEFAYGMRIYSTLIIGGASMRAQILNLQRNPQFIIGTPGRLKDLIERGQIPMQKIHTVVLDEADRMVDMGFIKDITHILSKVPAERQSLFFSATLPKDVTPIIEKFMKNPVTISVIRQQTAANVDQDVVRVQPDQNKIDVLADMLQQGAFYKVIVFGRTKRGVEKLSRVLTTKGIKAVSIHGDKPQRKREQAIKMFKTDVAHVLVATDVAARGIDIPDVSHVINYDQPATYDDYVHRIGRTGRGDKKGIALTFIDNGSSKSSDYGDEGNSYGGGRTQQNRDRGYNRGGGYSGGGGYNNGNSSYDPNRRSQNDNFNDPNRGMYRSEPYRPPKK